MFSRVLTSPDITQIKLIFMKKDFIKTYALLLSRTFYDYKPFMTIQVLYFKNLALYFLSSKTSLFFKYPWHCISLVSFFCKENIFPKSLSFHCFHQLDFIYFCTSSNFVKTFFSFLISNEDVLQTRVIVRWAMLSF